MIRFALLVVLILGSFADANGACVPQATKTVNWNVNGSITYRLWKTGETLPGGVWKYLIRRNDDPAVCPAGLQLTVETDFTVTKPSRFLSSCAYSLPNANNWFGWGNTMGPINFPGFPDTYGYRHIDLPYRNTYIVHCVEFPDDSKQFKAMVVSWGEAQCQYGSMQVIPPDCPALQGEIGGDFETDAQVAGWTASYKPFPTGTALTTKASVVRKSDTSAATGTGYLRWDATVVPRANEGKARLCSPWTAVNAGARWLTLTGQIRGRTKQSQAWVEVHTKRGCNSNGEACSFQSDPDNSATFDSKVVNNLSPDQTAGWKQFAKSTPYSMPAGTESARVCVAALPNDACGTNSGSFTVDLDSFTINTVVATPTPVPSVTATPVVTPTPRPTSTPRPTAPPRVCPTSCPTGQSCSQYDCDVFGQCACQ